MRNHLVTSKQPLLNIDGTLREPGWSKSLVQTYSRKDIKKRITRIKEWDYYSVISNKNNIAVVFDELPSTWKGVTVISGDNDDLRPLDPKGVIIGLLPKGKLRTAVKNNTDGGFVVRTNNKNINVINV